jgi:hypothetical protein
MRPTDSQKMANAGLRSGRACPRTHYRSRQIQSEQRRPAYQIRPASLAIVGTVLPWLADRRYAPLRGGAAFCEVLGRQAAEWRSLRRDHPDSGLCVLGDFNQDLARSHYYGSAHGRAALERALVEAQLVCLTAGARDPLAGVSGHSSIDHVCVSEGLLLDGLPSVAVWPSPPLERRRLTDHFGAYVDVRVSQAARKSTVE